MSKLKFTKVGSFLNFYFLSCSRLFTLPLSIFRRKETTVLNFVRLFVCCDFLLLAGNWPRCHQLIDFTQLYSRIFTICMSLSIVLHETDHKKAFILC